MNNKITISSSGEIRNFSVNCILEEFKKTISKSFNEIFKSNFDYLTLTMGSNGNRKKTFI